MLALKKNLCTYREVIYGTGEKSERDDAEDSLALRQGLGVSNNRIKGITNDKRSVASSVMVLFEVASEPIGKL